MIAQLFVPNNGPDGKPFYETDVGAHAVRLHRNGQWEVVVVDDYFPVQIDNPATKGKLPSETNCKGQSSTRAMTVAFSTLRLQPYFFLIILLFEF